MLLRCCESLTYCLLSGSPVSKTLIGVCQVVCSSFWHSRRCGSKLILFSKLPGCGICGPADWGLGPPKGMGLSPGPPGCRDAPPAGVAVLGRGPEAEAGLDSCEFDGGPPAGPGLGAWDCCCRPPDMLLWGGAPPGGPLNGGPP